MDICQLVAEIKLKLPGFLEKMKGDVPGSYRYSFTGDFSPGNYLFGFNIQIRGDVGFWDFDQ